MTERDFHHKSLNRTVRYSVGQPMGLLSSWAAFTITHHALIQYAAHLEGIKHFRAYRVIGDDVAIFHRLVASRYKSLLGLLEVEINLNKSTISESKPFSAEMAKRIFRDGDELSPIPPDI